MRDMKAISRKNRAYQERMNPCVREERLTQKCLEDNDYDHDKCSLHFKNVTYCREFWDEVKRDRMMKGIKPALPYPDEREQIKAERLKKNKD